MANAEETVAETIPEPPKRKQRDFSTLYAAVEQLEGRYKEVILRYYGLYDYAPESLPVVSRAITSGKSETMAGSYRALALKKLRKFLA